MAAVENRHLLDIERHAQGAAEGGLLIAVEPADKVGCIRNFNLRDGGNIRERLLALSDYDYTCTYSILESPMGVENYIATLKFTPITDGDRAFAGWSAEFDCELGREQELARLIGDGVFQAGFDALNAIAR